MIFLKSRNKHFHELEFAVLVDPTGPIHNDTEMYGAVLLHGRAIIRPLSVGGELGEPITLAPAQFEEYWRGD